MKTRPMTLKFASDFQRQTVLHAAQWRAPASRGQADFTGEELGQFVAEICRAYLDELRATRNGKPAESEGKAT
jgi:hypothetical protein